MTTQVIDKQAAWRRWTLIRVAFGLVVVAASIWGTQHLVTSLYADPGDASVTFPDGSAGAQTLVAQHIALITVSDYQWHWLRGSCMQVELQYDNGQATAQFRYPVGQAWPRLTINHRSPLAGVNATAPAGRNISLDAVQGMAEKVLTVVRAPGRNP